MTEFIFGVIGSLAVFTLLGIGGVIGWKAHGILRKPEVYTPVVPDEEEQREIKFQREQQKMFRDMQNYNADVAYGTKVDTSPLRGGER